MAKKSVTEKTYRQMMSSRQERKGGRFGGLKPQYQASKPAASAKEPNSEAGIAKQVNLLQSLIKQRQSMGFDTSELENYVVGMGDQRGVRSVVEDYIRANREKFNVSDPAGAAAYELMQEAVSLSEASLDASQDEAKRIYARLNFIKELAKKTEGKQGDIAKKLGEIISPVEEQLKKKSSFGEFLKEKASTFKKTIPEKIASKIPVVGGLLGEFLQKKREAREDIEKYTGSLQKQIARKGRRGGGLDIKGQGIGSLGSVGMGGTRASDIPGMFGQSTGEGQASSTLGEILKEISQIRKLIENKFAPESDAVELKKREAELEGLGAGKSSKKGGGMLSSIRNMMGMGSGGGILSSIASGAGSVGAAMLGAPSLAMKGIRGAGSLAMKGIRGAGSMIGGAVGGAGKMLGGAGGFLSNLAGKAGSAISSMNPVKGLTSFIGKNAGKVVKGITSIPGIGGIMSSIMGAVDIASIKSNPDLSPEEKKEQIGRAIVGTLGEAIGSIGGGALGTFIPVPGIGTLVGTLGGSWVGGKLAEVLADQLGGKGIYDMVSSIPGVGSLIEVGGTEDQKTEKEAGSVVAGAAGAVSAEGGASASTMVEGKITSPATANTSVGRMVAQTAAEQNGLNEARNVSAPTGGATTNNANVQNKISNTTNNFNDDIRIRNNEPTIKQMQAFSIVP